MSNMWLEISQWRLWWAVYEMCRYRWSDACGWRLPSGIFELVVGHLEVRYNCDMVVPTVENIIAQMVCGWRYPTHVCGGWCMRWSDACGWKSSRVTSSNSGTHGGQPRGELQLSCGCASSGDDGGHDGGR
jgi:hypothetical protein